MVEERAAKIGAEGVDEDVLNRLVDAATHAPPDKSGSAVINPNEGQSLLRRMEDLYLGARSFPASLLCVSSGHARVYLCCKANWSGCCNGLCRLDRIAGCEMKAMCEVGTWKESKAVGSIEEKK